MGRDAAIAALAGRQHGVVARVQLLALGLTSDAIQWRLEHARLHRLHRGVYAVGHTVLSGDARLMAATLAVGRCAVSHRTAGALWAMRPWSGAIEVTTPRSLHRRPGVRVVRRPLPADEVRQVRGIAVTSPPRTLIDLAGVLEPGALERAYEQTLILELADDLPLAALFERYPRAKGIASLRALAGVEVVGITRDELERRFRNLVRGAKLPKPQTNIVVEGFEADCVWPEQRLVVELDGRSTHLNAVAFERDRERDRVLQAAGWRVARITWRQVRDQPRRVAGDLAAILGCPA